MYTTYNAIPGKVRFEWIGEAWQLYSQRWGTWFTATLVYSIITLCIQMPVGYYLGMFDGIKFALAAIKHPPAPGTVPVVPHPDPLSAALYYAVSFVLGAFFAGGLMKMANAQVRGESISVGNIFGGGGIFLQILGFQICISALMIAGLICLSSGGALALVGLLPLIATLFIFALFWPAIALIADGTSIGAAFSRAFAATRQDWLMATLFALVFGLIVAVSAIPCYLGLLITTPMMYLSTALAYRDMIGMPGSPIDPAGAPYTGPAGPGAWPPAPEPNPAKSPAGEEAHQGCGSRL